MIKKELTWYTLEEKIPDYDNMLLCYHENGTITFYWYWAVSLKSFKEYFKMDYDNMGKVLCWAYSKDIELKDKDYEELIDEGM